MEGSYRRTSKPNSRRLTGRSEELRKLQDFEVV